MCIAVSLQSNYNVITNIDVRELMAMTEAKKRNEGTMTLRVDRDLLKAFQNIAKDNNRTASQLVRDYMMNYVKKHGQGDLFK